MSTQRSAQGRGEKKTGRPPAHGRWPWFPAVALTDQEEFALPTGGVVPERDPLTYTQVTDAWVWTHVSVTSDVRCPGRGSSGASGKAARPVRPAHAGRLLCCAPAHGDAGKAVKLKGSKHGEGLMPQPGQRHRLACVKGYGASISYHEFMTHACLNSGLAHALAVAPAKWSSHYA